MPSAPSSTLYFLFQLSDDKLDWHNMGKGYVSCMLGIKNALVVKSETEGLTAVDGGWRVTLDGR